jgi:hypothetical protein
VIIVIIVIITTTIRITTITTITIITIAVEFTKVLSLIALYLDILRFALSFVAREILAAGSEVVRI